MCFLSSSSRDVSLFLPYSGVMLSCYIHDFQVEQQSSHLDLVSQVHALFYVVLGSSIPHNKFCSSTSIYRTNALLIRTSGNLALLIKTFTAWTIRLQAYVIFVLNNAKFIYGNVGVETILSINFTRNFIVLTK